MRAEAGGGRLDCFIRLGWTGTSWLLVLASILTRPDLSASVVTGVTIPEGTDIIVTEAIESLSSPGSGSGSILLVL